MFQVLDYYWLKLSPAALLTHWQPEEPAQTRHLGGPKILPLSSEDYQNSFGQIPTAGFPYRQTSENSVELYHEDAAVAVSTVLVLGLRATRERVRTSCSPPVAGCPAPHRRWILVLWACLVLKGQNPKIFVRWQVTTAWKQYYVQAVFCKGDWNKGMSQAQKSH